MLAMAKAGGLIGGRRSLVVEWLAVAGGGRGATGSGTHQGGAGGAGGLLQGTQIVTDGDVWTAVVGRGGARDSNPSGNGEDTTLTAPSGLLADCKGGGAGGGSSGGSGGGGSAPFGEGGAGIPGQGHAGGSVGNQTRGGAGGGAGSAASVLTRGAGVVSDINGVPTEYARGGASGSNAPLNPGDGAGSSFAGTLENHMRGNNGVVIVRYRGGQKATGGTVTSWNGWTIHTMTPSTDGNISFDF